MTCNVCNPLLDIEERKMPIDKVNAFDEYWYIDFDENSCDIIVDYDCAFATQRIEGINYCPVCGRKLK